MCRLLTYSFRWLLLIVMMIVSMNIRAQHVAVKNNLAYDATLTPNIGLEFGVAPRWTLGLNAGYNPWWHHATSNPFPFALGTARGESDRSQWRHLLVAPEARYWFCSTFAGHFIGFRALYMHYNIGNVKLPMGLYSSLREKRRQGDAVAGGVFYGYSWLLSTRWSLEAEAGVDVGYTWYKEYDCTHCGTYYGKDDKPFLKPKIGLNIIYNIK